jgi:hypothetical protein
MPTLYVQRGYQNGLQVMKFHQDTPYVESYDVRVSDSLWGSPVLKMISQKEQMQNPGLHIKYESKSIEPGTNPLQLATTLIEKGQYKISTREVYEELEKRYLKA